MNESWMREAAFAPREWAEWVRIATALALCVWPVLWLTSLSAYKWLLGPAVAPAWPLRRRVVLGLASFAAGAAAMLGVVLDLASPAGATRPLAQGSKRLLQTFEVPPPPLLAVHLLAVGLLVVLGLGLSVKLFEKWVNRRLTDAERAGGAAGARAWVGGSNAFLAVTIVLAAGFTGAATGWEDGVEWATAAAMVIAAALLVHPLIALLLAAGATPSPADPGPTVGLSSERERVLRLLESGKITADECAELLTALAATAAAAPPPSSRPWSAGWAKSAGRGWAGRSGRAPLIAGAALVVVGTFLPWFSYNSDAD
ncbi:MAG: hypothetical protein JWO31_662, partial [Phycisphaerales bacterium]|nr:hypothetical protein [Phycisphaerales bacterium]